VLIALAKPTVAIPVRIRLPVFFPYQLQGQMAMLLQLLMNHFPVRLRPLRHRFGPDRWVPKQLGFQFFFAQPFRQGPPPLLRRTVLSPIPQLRAICRCPNPNSNRNLRTSLTLRMDFLLAGTLFSLIYGVSMPGYSPAPLRAPAVRLGKHSAPSRTPFRLGQQKLFAFPPESRCSPSERNAVRLQTGIAFTFDRIPHQGRSNL
jgi:hypothetical protein